MFTFHFLRFFALFINTITPGAGFVVLGHWRLAFYYQIVLFASLVLLSWSRFVFEPIALGLLITLVLCVYVLSFIVCFKLKPIQSHSVQHRVISSLFFMVMSFALLSSVFMHKQQWLGVHVFFVPSHSMQPTLQPGQFILVDTWAYKTQPPQVNDVVVFRHHQSQQWLVKRIAYWPNGFLKQQQKWYMLGDNTQQSRDSRYFGGVHQQNIVGKVRLVLLGFKDSNESFSNQFLKPVS